MRYRESNRRRARSHFCDEKNGTEWPDVIVLDIEMPRMDGYCSAPAPNLRGLIILTGMGDDGAHGMKEMHEAGALTIAQDEAGCVVYGMPKEAVKLGAVDGILPLSAIPQLIMQAPTRALFKKPRT
ncbi:MAG: chemotaxis protein CheB [Methylobacter sp.]|nr:chemotaxis protein CheB [Methylobacter sp.]